MADYSPQAAAEKIQTRKPQFTPQMALILGSGLGELAHQLHNPTSIAYRDIPGFSKEQIEGHAGKLVLGYFHNVPVVCLQGRPHLYQGLEYLDTIKLMIRTLSVLGCQTLLVTNASGSLKGSIDPGDLVLVYDHINFQCMNPLVGPNDEDFGPRFVGMEDAYCPQLRHTFLDCAQSISVNLHQGVYIATSGPVFETPAEIRAFQILGADIVGMSTVPEVIVAHHCGLKVAVVSAVTNKAAGLSEQPLSHELTIEGAKKATKKMRDLFEEYFKRVPEAQMSE